ncbi:hypothetical protein EMCRGX_G027174 [Ephydatia muelleri]|eukprot:Em0014g242a
MSARIETSFDSLTSERKYIAGATINPANDVRNGQHDVRNGQHDDRTGGPTIEDNMPRTRAEKWRNVFAFWILGLCNNFPYVVMLSAAFDILSQLENKASATPSSGAACTVVGGEYPGRKCNKLSTSVILLADILPNLFIKLIGPSFMHFIPYGVRVLVVALLAASCFIVVSLAESIQLVLLGVVFASMSSGFGEVTFLSFTTRYHKSTVGGWSSGTGAAGVGGSVIYTVLTLFLTPRVAILLQVAMPILMGIAYLFVLTTPSQRVAKVNAGTPPSPEETRMLLETSPSSTPRAFSVGKAKSGLLWLRDQGRYIPNLFPYMVPLFIVFAAEYMINQGLFELLYYRNTSLGTWCLDGHLQYRWYQVLYQVGVFLSRSSVLIFQTRFYWVMSLLQVANFQLLFCEAIYGFIPSFWITIFIILFEGLMGGAVYANAFYYITKQVPAANREFSMGVAAVADSTGIVTAGFASIGIHNYICNL